MGMPLLSRWGIAVAMAAGLGMSTLVAAPARAQDKDDWVRVMVDIADVMYHAGQPYYRHGYGHGPQERLVVVYDRYQRPVYYRQVQRVAYRFPPRAYGYAPVVYHAPQSGHVHHRHKVRYDHPHRDSRHDDRRDRRYRRDWNGRGR